MEEIFKSNLCKCNNCELILVDKNPQINAKEQAVFKDKNNQWVNLENIEVADMEYLEDKNGDNFWACPVCEVDDFLIDI
jgi:phage-related protein